MTAIEFFPYSDTHIRFKLTDGRELSGVLLSTEDKKSDTIYPFIPTTNMIEWKHAKQKNDNEKMKKLQSEIDIKNIVWAVRIKY